VTEAEIAALERKYEKWSGKATMLIMPAVFVALLTLPIVTFHQNSLPLYMLASPVVLLLAVLFVIRAAQRWEDNARSRIATHYHNTYLKTRWRTVADAEGVVIGVSTFGTGLTLAFGNGVKETYERGMLTRID